MVKKMEGDAETEGKGKRERLIKTENKREWNWDYKEI